MKKLMFLSAAVGVLLFSCKKDNPEPENPATPGSTSSMGSFFTSNGVATQNFTIDATTYQIITGSSGTIIYIPGNSFVTQSNQPVTGSVSIELREIFSKGDMILSNAPTTSGGKPLISGGEIYFSAKQNNQKLKLSGSATVYAQVPAGANPSLKMKEFYASQLTATDDWDTTSSAPVIPVFQDSLSSKNYYYFQVDSMNWINCDYFYSPTGPATTIKTTVGSSYDSSNCFVFVSFNGQNSAAACRTYNNHTFGPNAYYTLPVGLNVTFVAIALKNGQYYSAFQPSVIVNNHNEMLTLTPTTLSQIKADISNLP